MYRDGIGIEPNIGKAIEWYRKAARQGNSVAQYQLGMIYSDSDNRYRDHDEAYYWMKNAAENGYVLAQYRLGIRYEHGIGTKKSLILAYMWNEIAAEGGDSDALEKKYELVGKMTLEQLSHAKKMAKKWLSTH